MENLNKKLPYGLWAISGLMVLLFLITDRGFGIKGAIITAIVAFVPEAILGYTILRDRNDTFMVFAILLYTIAVFNIASIVAVVLRLVLKKKKDSEKIRNYWALPSVVCGIAVIYSVRTDGLSGFSKLLTLILTVVFYLIYGYWFIKHLE